jgi:hypothetical protein
MFFDPIVIAGLHAIRNFAAQKHHATIDTPDYFPIVSAEQKVAIATPAKGTEAGFDGHGMGDTHHLESDERKNCGSILTQIVACAIPELEAAQIGFF